MCPLSLIRTQINRHVHAIPFSRSLDLIHVYPPLHLELCLDHWDKHLNKTPSSKKNIPKQLIEKLPHLSFNVYTNPMEY